MIKEYNDRKRALEQNILKASELIIGHCNKTIENRIKAIPDYETRVMDDPIVSIEGN